MKFIFKYMTKYRSVMIMALIIKFFGTAFEFVIPYILEYMLDEVAPTKNIARMIGSGLVMVMVALLVRQLNIMANRRAVRIAASSIHNMREDLFQKTMQLSGNQVDKYGLPSLTTRMTSDSYNVQNFMRAIMTLGVRAPLILVGGMVVTLTMDAGLASILIVIVPIVAISVMVISAKGIPMYEKVQQRVDTIVRIMRENITGIRVVKALSKEEYETEHYRAANVDLFADDTKASVVMSLPGPLTTLVMNVGLTAVVLIGARRVDSGLTQPGVILAFLTYFNMIQMGVNGINRIFIMTSKANASASRIRAVIEEGKDLQEVYGETESTSEKQALDKQPFDKQPLNNQPLEKPFISFEHVYFDYDKGGSEETQEYELTDVSFSMGKGQSLGIIGATGSGKTTIINLLMRFYDTTSGTVYVDGRDVKSMSLKELRSRFGVVFQNDVIFADSLLENIAFGRAVNEAKAMQAVTIAQAREFVEEYEDGLEHKADIHGANLSGGQKQRILIARALAAKPEILVLDDASSALDYKTDANLRRMIREQLQGTTSIIIAQRISSIMSLDHILVLDEGRIVGQGTHEHLMETCSLYREIYEVQMN